MNKHKIARDNEQQTQQYQKCYIDKRRHAKESDISVGDTVLVNQQYKNKFSARFDKTPYVVIERKGTMVTAENEARRITRNVSNFKKFKARTNQHDESESETGQEFKTQNNHTEQEHGEGPDQRRQSTRPRMQPERFGSPIPSRLIP